MLDCVEKPGREIGEAAETSFRTDGHFFMSSKFHGGDAGPDGRGAPVDKVQFTVQGWPRTVEFKWIEMHLALYAFFSNFGSILDRLSFEVNLMYELRARKVDWAKLLGVPPFPVKLLQALHEKDAKLADFVKSQAPLFEKAIGYRNRLVHDGLIEFNPEITHRGIAVWLRENPSDAASEMNVNALAFCGRTKADMLNLLNQSYSQMLAYFRANLSHTDVRS